jgi:hypothetical protein
MLNRRLILAGSLATCLLAFSAADLQAADVRPAARSNASMSNASTDQSAVVISPVDARAVEPLVRPRVARNQKRPRTEFQCWGCFAAKRCGPDDKSCWSDHSGRACNINQGECNIACSTQHACAAS